MLSSLHTNAKVIKEINKLFYSFLWNGKGDKIKRDIIINDYPNGGLKIIINKSLKATWIYLDEENQGKWKYFFDLELERHGGSIVLTSNLNKKDTIENLKIKNVLSCWEYRRLTLIGKIRVLKSLVASQLVYVLSSLHTNAKVIKEINKLFYSFLWNGKGDKIKRDIIINDYPNGGLKIIINKSLKATWIYLDEENQGKWKYFFDLELERHGGSIVLTSNLNKKDTIENLKIKNCFIKETLLIWA